MPTIGTRGNAAARGYGFTGAAPEVLGGMVLMTPTSIASTGTGNSSSIGENGSVTFSSCATLSLNGVFTSSYDNYMMVMRSNTSTTSNYQVRLRVGGTDNSTASSYTYQYIQASSTTVVAGRTTTNFGYINAGANTRRDGTTVYFYGPNLAQPTAFRSVTMYDANSAVIFDMANTHNQSTAYDGFTLFTDIGTATGLVTVYGLGG